MVSTIMVNGGQNVVAY